MSKAEVIAAAKKAIDAVKTQQNMTAVQAENVQITVNDCSVSSLTSLVNSIVQRFTGEKSATYKFVNGQATGVRPDGKEVEDEGVVSPTQVIPPKNRTFETAVPTKRTAIDPTIIACPDGSIFSSKKVVAIGTSRPNNIIANPTIII